MNRPVNPVHILIIIIIGSVLFLPFLGAVHLFDWDEINFAESAREMLVSGDYSRVQINYQPFWEKPPLFIWMQVISMKLFGVGEFAARFPNAVFGILTLCMIYYKGKIIFKGHLAHWWVLCYLGAITPHFYFKTGLIDPVFNFFIFLGILEFYKAMRHHSPDYNSNRHFLAAGVFTGIAILCKGPVALLVSILVLLAMVISRRLVRFFDLKNILLYLFSSALVSSVWFLPETIKNGPYFIIDFLNYQLELFSDNVAGHGQPFWYHPFVLLIGCFPASIIALATWKRNEIYMWPENAFRLTMNCLFWVVLVLFSIVRTKIVHYSSLCWLPLTFLAAYGIESINHKQFKFSWLWSLVLTIVGMILSAILIALPLILMKNKAWLINRISDPFTRENLGAAVTWGYQDLIPGILLVLLMLIFFLFQTRLSPVSRFGILLTGNVLIISLASIRFTPKIEQITQSTPITFFESLQSEDCYIFNTGYKSYAPLFYSRTLPLKYTDGLNLRNESFYKLHNKRNLSELNSEEKAELDDWQKEWLLHGNIDKTVYFIAKFNDQEGLDMELGIELLKNENGFVIYKRQGRR